MTDIAKARGALLARLESGRDEQIAFLSRFLQCRSANPPGDTLSAAALVTGFLTERGVPNRIESAFPHMPNVVGGFDGARPGRHLVMNGHIDVFPALDDSGWSGDIRDGRI